LISSPAFLKRYYLFDEEHSSCAAVFSSGGVLDFAAAVATEKNFAVAPIEVYGSTESGGVGYRQRKTEEQEWHAFPTVHISIGADNLLSIQSPFFDDPFLLMNDLAEKKNSGFLLLGRNDDVVKIEEKRISLSQMNNKILQSPYIKESVVISLQQNQRQQTACLATLTEQGITLAKERGDKAVAEHIRLFLGSYFESVVIPRKFRFVESLPYNEQSKLKRADLLEYFNDQR